MGGWSPLPGIRTLNTGPQGAPSATRGHGEPGSKASPGARSPGASTVDVWPLQLWETNSCRVSCLVWVLCYGSHTAWDGWRLARPFFDATSDAKPWRSSGCHGEAHRGFPSGTGRRPWAPGVAGGRHTGCPPTREPPQRREQTPPDAARRPPRGRTNVVLSGSSWKTWEGEALLSRAKS